MNNPSFLELAAFNQHSKEIEKAEQAVQDFILKLAKDANDGVDLSMDEMQLVTKTFQLLARSTNEMVLCWSQETGEFLGLKKDMKDGSVDK